VKKSLKFPEIKKDEKNEDNFIDVLLDDIEFDESMYSDDY